jgi:putative acetyltransferase
MITIERATVKDHPEITDVWEASVRATHGFLKEEDIHLFRPIILNEALHAVKLFCAKNETGEIQGFLGTSKDKIEMLFLKPSSIGKGLGKAFMHYAINNLRATKVDVNEQNPQAVGFYEHFGFKTVHRSAVDGMGKPYPILSMELTF